MQQKPTQQFTESLSGLIERVTFHNEENGWAVFTLSGLLVRLHEQTANSLRARRKDRYDL